MGRPKRPEQSTPHVTLPNAACGMETRARKRKRLAGETQEAIPGLPDDIIVTHILRYDYFDAAERARLQSVSRGMRDAVTATDEAFSGLPNYLVAAHILAKINIDDPADLARLRVVSHGMRGAVAATGRRVEKSWLSDAVEIGCLSAVKRLQRRDGLSRQEYLCQAAARSGQLEELKALRAKGCRWDEYTCSAAAKGGQFEVLQWARANGCPWNRYTCMFAAQSGHLELLQWARANGCPWDESTCWGAAYCGHLEILQWALANGCTWDRFIRDLAEGRGFDVEALDRLTKRGAP